MGSSEKSPLPGSLLRLVPKPTESDEIDLDFKSIDSIEDPLDVLPSDRFEPWDIIQHESSLPTMRFLEIIEGLARETIYVDGRRIGDVFDLQTGNIIGLTRFARVEACTVLIVRVIDLKQMCDNEEHELFERAVSRVLDMGLNQIRASRQRAAELSSELSDSERREINLMKSLERLKASKQRLQAEYSGRIERRMGELVGTRIKHLRDENKRLREDKARFEKDIEADLKSQQSMLETIQTLAAEQDEEIAALKTERDNLRRQLEGIVNALKK